jgi:hypothetical protein
VVRGARTLLKHIAALALFVALPVHAQEDLTTRDAEGTPEPPPAPFWSPVYTGSYFTRYELRHGYDDLGISRGRFLEGDALFYRLRFGLNTGLIDVGQGIKVALQFTPQASGTFGDHGPNTIADATLGLHEGFARVKGKLVRLDAGRYEMIYGDCLMIGNNDWNEVGRTFDGVRARIGSRGWLDLFANVIDEGRPDALGAGKGDLYFLGAYGALGPLIRQAFELDLYALARVWGGGVQSDVHHDAATEVTLGTRSKARFGIIDYRVETGLQTGSKVSSRTMQTIDVLAWQGDLELGVTFADDKLRIALEGLYATGSKPGAKHKDHAWEDLFPSGHKWLGLMDAFNLNGMKRTDVASGVVHVSANPITPITMQLDGHLFARPEPTNGQSGFAGGELDINVVYAIAKGLKVRALYGVFLPDDELYHDQLPPKLGAPDPAQYFEAELRYDLF